jgi:hypothetical protein
LENFITWYNGENFSDDDYGLVCMILIGTQ